MFDRRTAFKSTWVAIATAVAVGAGVPLSTASAQTRPALVRDTDNPAQQPFRALISISLGNNETFKLANGPTVPAGKRLVVENVSIWIFTGSGSDIATGVWLTVPGANPPTFLLADPTSAERKLVSGGSSITAYNRLTRLYYNPGEVIQAQVFFDGVAGSKNANIYLNGYLVDLP